MPSLNLQRVKFIVIMVKDCQGVSNYTHRRTGNFLPKGGGGVVKHLPKEFSQVAQIFTKQSKRNEGHTMH